MTNVYNVDRWSIQQDDERTQIFEDDKLIYDSQLVADVVKCCDCNELLEHNKRLRNEAITYYRLAWLVSITVGLLSFVVIRLGYFLLA
jgi:predicted nucleic acid-binding Zn ribbon protein